MSRTATRKRPAGSKGGQAKRKLAPVALAPSPWDMGATGQANRIGLEVEDAADIDAATGNAPNPNGVKRARRVDMLERWHRTGKISTAGFNAAEKLRDAFEQTERAPGWPDNDRVQSSPKPDHAVAIQIDRISRYHSISSLIDPRDTRILDVCVLGSGSPRPSAIVARAMPQGCSTCGMPLTVCLTGLIAALDSEMKMRKIHLIARASPGNGLGFLLARAAIAVHHHRMTRIITTIAALALSGCVTSAEIQSHLALVDQCNAARTYGDRYGTPSNRGPCWAGTTAHSVVAGMQSFGVRIRGSQYGVAYLVYQGDRLVSASESY